MPSWREYRDAYKAHFKGERPAFDPADLPPEQRARYDAAMAEVARGEQEIEAAHQDFVDRQVLQGPALPGFVQMRAQPQSHGLRQAFKQSWDLNREVERAHTGPPRIEDPVEAAQVAAAERAAREAARAPYRAPDPPLVTITRLMTRGRSQLDDVIAHLQRTGLAARTPSTAARSISRKSISTASFTAWFSAACSRRPPRSRRPTSSSSQCRPRSPRMAGTPPTSPTSSPPPAMSPKCSSRATR
jgi:hypothetical protein